MTNIKRVITIAIFLIALTGINACSDATIASNNLSKAAEMFELERRIVFYNTWKGEYLLSIEGRCSIEYGNRVAVTCKTGPNSFKKHYLGMSGHVTYFSEQLKSSNVSVYHYRVIFKPEAIIPDVDAEISLLKEQP